MKKYTVSHKFRISHHSEVIEAWSHEDAADIYAEKYDLDSGHLYAGGRTDISVTDDRSFEVKFTIYAKIIVTYGAIRINS